MFITMNKAYRPCCSIHVHHRIKMKKKRGEILKYHHFHSLFDVWRDACQVSGQASPSSSNKSYTYVVCVSCCCLPCSWTQRFLIEQLVWTHVLKQRFLDSSSHDMVQVWRIFWFFLFEGLKCFLVKREAIRATETWSNRCPICREDEHLSSVILFGVDQFWQIHFFQFTRYFLKSIGILELRA